MDIYTNVGWKLSRKAIISPKIMCVSYGIIQHVASGWINCEWEGGKMLMKIYNTASLMLFRNSIVSPKAHAYLMEPASVLQVVGLIVNEQVGNC